jgi:hypothetical protein
MHEYGFQNDLTELRTRPLDPRQVIAFADEFAVFKINQGIVENQI